MNSRRQVNTLWLRLGAGLLLLVGVYHAFGVTVWRGASGNSLFGWLYMMWSSESTEAVDYSHGLVIPFVSLWLLWRRRGALHEACAQPQPHAFGPALLGVALLLHVAGLRSQIPHLSALSFILALWGLVWAMAGAQLAGLTQFPLAFLGFAIPVGFLAQATFPLRMLGSVVAMVILNGLGIETVRHGTAVFSTAGQGFAMDVADACSGIRSIMALMALTAVYAYVFRKHNPVRWFLFAMSVPIAAAANIGRIITIAIVALLLGQETGLKLYHDYSGYLVFVLCVLLIIATDRMMSRVGMLKSVLLRKERV